MATLISPEFEIKELQEKRDMLMQSKFPLHKGTLALLEYYNNKIDELKTFINNDLDLNKEIKQEKGVQNEK